MESNKIKTLYASMVVFSITLPSALAITVSESTCLILRRFCEAGNSTIGCISNRKLFLCFREFLRSAPLETRLFQQ